jgi:WD40 repeat protein
MENASCFAVHNSENIFVLGQNNLSKKSSIQIISARKAEEWNFTTDPLITSSEGISDISFLNSVLLYGTSFGKVLYYKCSMNGSIRSFNLEQTFLPVDQNGVNLRSNQSHLSKSYLQSYKVAKVRLTPLTTDAFFCVENNRFHFWNIKNPEKPALTSELTSHGYICSAEWNLHAPSQFASGSSHGSLSLFDLRKIGKNASKTAAWKVSDAHSESIRTISWNPSSAELIASASDDGTIKVWDIRVNKDPLCVLQGHLNGVSCLSWHPKNVDVLVSGSLDRTVRLWNLRVSPHYQIYQHDAFSGHSIGVGYIGGSGGLYACASSEGEVFVGETSESFLK